MSEQAKGDYAKFLRGIADGLTSVPTPYNLREAEIVREAAAELERLRTEVERLTPREMSPERVAVVLNRHEYKGFADWSWREGSRRHVVQSTWHATDGHGISIDESTALYVAQGLLRDGGKGGAG